MNTHVKRLFAVVCVVAGLLLLSAPSFAEEEASRVGHVNIGVGFGPMAGTQDGTAFGIGFNGDYFVSNEVSVGPLLQLGFDGDFTLVGLSGQVKYTFDLPTQPQVHPNAQVGMGFVHVSDGGVKDDTDFLVPLGGGVDVDLAKNLALGTTLLINVTGLQDDIFLTWLFGLRLFI